MSYIILNCVIVRVVHINIIMSDIHSTLLMEISRCLLYLGDMLPFEYCFNNNYVEFKELEGRTNEL